ncbi:sulfate transporter CysZ [Zobellella maritima]|uniref:sulfate transporter CysZ n=1 Tax=Zobellella maritima TaxID=2059725 RepID=UPI000E306B5A|nr:sulfate transporter CysZ [Zobellella maritima]
MSSSAHRMAAPISGPHYLLRGLSLVRSPELRLFVLIPLSVNLLLFGAAFYMLYLQLERLFDWLNQSIPSYLEWLNYLLWPLAIISVLVVFSLIFTTIANMLAAPFNGLLAERVEQKLTGERLHDSGWASLIKDTPRMLGREWRKLAYYLPRALGCLLLFLIPALGQTLAPVLWFLFTAWMMTIQYCDYPFDNHKIDFTRMRRALAEKRGLTWSFGAGVALCSALPLVNLLIMPVAICGATALWVDHYRQPMLRE